MVKKCKKNVSPPIFKDPFFSNFEANQGASNIKKKQLLKKQKKVKFQIEYLKIRVHTSRCKKLHFFPELWSTVE